MFELRHLRYFIAVAEELSFTRAAERLHTAQPSLSRQIRHLEDQVGIPLFVRTNRRVELTAAGQRFLGEAQLVLAQVKGAVTRVRQIGGVERLKIGFAAGLILQVLPRILPSIRLNFPDVEVVTRSMLSHEIRQAIKDETLDIAFTRHISTDDDIVAEKIFEESLVAVFPSGHPQAESDKPISLQALQRYEIIIGAASVIPELRYLLDERCSTLGIRLNIAHEVGDIFDAVALVTAGCGIGIFSCIISPVIPIGLSTRRLDASGPRPCVVVAYKADAKLAKLGRLLDISRELQLRIESTA